MVFPIMMDSAKNYCYSVVGQLKEKLFHALHDGGSASINLAMHYYKRQTHPYIEQNCLNGKSLDKIRFIADTAKEGNFSPLIKLIRHLIEERLGDSDAAIEVNAYLERVKDAATGCLLIHSHQLPTAPIGLGEALTQKIAIVCVNHQLYLVEKELNNEQKVSPLLDDPTNLIKHQAYIRAKKFFEGMRLGKSKLAEVHELKALNDAFDLNIISALECVIRDYIPAFRKLKVSQYVKDKLNESDVVRNGELMLFSQNQTDSHHLSQIKKIINALFLIQRGLERCERLPVNFGNLDDVNYQLSTIAALGPLVDDLYNGYQLLSHPDFEISIFKEMFSFLIPMANHIGGMLPVLSDLVPELSESDHIHLAKKIGYIAGFSINQLHPHELHGQFDYAFLTGFGAHIPGYLSDLSALMTASAPDLGNEKAIDLKIKALEKNGMQLLNGLDALQKGDFLASINILNYIHILRNSYDLIQAILKEFEHLSESSKVKILSLIRALKYDCIAPLSGIFDKIQAENLLSSTEISANFGDMIGPWYEQLIHVASNVVDFSKEQDLLTLDEPRFVETRLKTAYEQQLNDQKKIILFDLNIVTLETFMTDLRTIQGVGLFDDHEKKKRLIANYRLLQPYAEKLRPRLSNDIVKHLNGAKCVSTGLLRDIETLKMHLLGHFSQMKSTINFHTQLVEDCIDAVNQGVDDSCGIVRMEVDPTTLSFKIIFEQLHSSKKVKNLIILFDGKLYFADRKKHEVSEIKKPESSDDLELHLINQIYNYEKLKALNFSAELTVAKPETLALISTVTGRYFRQVSMTPWPIYQNVFRMDVSAEAPIEQEKALFVELKKLARAKKAYTLFLNEIRTFDGLISFGMLDYDKKEALRKQYALFQPVLVSALRLVPGIHKLDTQLIHALSGKVQTYKEPLNIQALRDVFDEVVRCIDEKAIDIDHQLGVLKNRTAPVVVQSNHLLVENKALEKREPYLVKNTEPFIKITEQLTLALDNLFDNIDPKIRTRFLAQKMNGVPYPELENERQLEAQPVQILMYKQFKNALYYIKEANQKIIKLKDTDKVTDANETLVWTAVNLGFGIKQHKTEVLIDVAAVSSDIYSAYALISAVSKDALIPEVSHIQTLFNNACKRVQQGLIQPVYLDQAWGLIKSPIDPKTVKFQDLDKSFKYESAVILYNGKLYYTDRADKKVKQLIETESNKEACEQIEQLCQDEFKLADSHELSLIVSAIGKPLQKEDDALLLGLNALMSGPDHFKGEPTAEALALAKKQAKKASVDIWRMTLDSSQSWFKLLQEIPTCTALIKHLKNKIKLFAKEGNKATKEN